jgi:hypothetical protein
MCTLLKCIPEGWPLAHGNGQRHSVLHDGQAVAARATHLSHALDVYYGIVMDAAKDTNGQSLLEITKTFRAGHLLVVNKVEGAYVVFADDI